MGLVFCGLSFASALRKEFNILQRDRTPSCEPERNFEEVDHIAFQQSKDRSSEAKRVEFRLSCTRSLRYRGKRIGTKKVQQRLVLDVRKCRRAGACLPTNTNPGT